MIIANKVEESRNDWHSVLIETNYSLPTANSKNFNDIYKWLYANLNPATFYWSIPAGPGGSNTKFFFEHQEDAALFKITWA